MVGEGGSDLNASARRPRPPASEPPPRGGGSGECARDDSARDDQRSEPPLSPRLELASPLPDEAVGSEVGSDDGE